MFKLDISKLYIADKLYCYEVLKPYNGIIELTIESKPLLGSLLILKYKKTETKNNHIYFENEQMFDNSKKYMLIGVNLKNKTILSKDEVNLPEEILEEINLAQKKKVIYDYMNSMKFYDKEYKFKIEGMFKIIQNQIGVMEDLF